MDDFWQAFDHVVGFDGCREGVAFTPSTHCPPVSMPDMFRNKTRYVLFHPASFALTDSFIDQLRLTWFAMWAGPIRMLFRHQHPEFRRNGSRFLREEEIVAS